YTLHVCSFSISFFFAPLYLLSFPTRRSSDLLLLFSLVRVQKSRHFRKIQLHGGSNRSILSIHLVLPVAHLLLLHFHLLNLAFSVRQVCLFVSFQNGGCG